MSPPSDLTERFLLENLDIRGQVVRLGPLWRQILARREYPESLRQLLGEFAAIAVLIASGLKHPGRAVLQVIGHGPISLAVADCTHDLALRAMLKRDEKAALIPDPSPASGRREKVLPSSASDGGENVLRPSVSDGDERAALIPDPSPAGGRREKALPSTAARGPGGGELTIHDHFPTGRLVLTLENASTARHFQSIVPLEGTTLADCFERYFDRSEQVPTHLWVHATEQSVGALILQKLPKADERDPNGWARVQRQAALNAPHCLGSEGEEHDIAALLTTFFPEDDVRLFKPFPVKDGCSRSEEKVIAMLKGLGRAEIEATLAEHGVVKVHDEVCNHEYRFTAADMARIFEA